MADLGEFARARAEEEGEVDTFTFYGERFDVPAGISVVVIMDFIADVETAQQARSAAIDALARAAEAVELARTDAARELAQTQHTTADVELVGANNQLMKTMRTYVQGCLVTDEAWRRFNGVCRRNAVDVEELMEVCGRIYAAVSARPTRRSSGSSDGPSRTGDGSTDASASPAISGPRLVQDPPPRPLLSPALDSTGESEQRTVLGDVIELTDAQRQQAEIRRSSVPVSELLGMRSGS